MKRVLIIDDQDDLRRLLRHAVQSFGYETREAADGREGIAVCREWNPHIILTDIFMPERDGLEIMRELRNSSSRARVIAMSGGGNMGHLNVLRTARAMGAAGVLTKPFSMQSLRETFSALEDDGGDGGESRESVQD